MRLLNSLNERLGRIEGFLLGFFLLTMTLLAFLQVIMRDLVGVGLPWADSLVRLLVIWVGFLGATLATRLEQNLTVEVLTKFLPPKLHSASSIIVKLFCLVVCIFLLEASCRFLADERGTGELFVSLFPSWWTLLIIPATFVLIPLHLVIGILNDGRKILKGGNE